MSKLFKICSILLGVLVIAVIAGAVALVTLVNPNRYKNQITQQIYKTTGHQATIGNIGWSIFPWIKLQINDVTLNNPTGFPSTPFVSVQQAAVSIDLMALLKRKLIVDNIDIRGMQVNLIHTLTNNNWSMPSVKSIPVTLSSNTTATTTNSHTNLIKSFNINNIAISNSHINWQDTVKNQNISFKINSLNTSNINLDGNSFTINSNFTYQTAQLPQPVNLKLRANINANKNTQQYNINNLALSLNQFEITGKAQINQTPSFTLNASLSILTTNAATLLNELGYAITFKNKSALTNVGGNIALTINKNSIQINGLALNVDGTKINGQANLTQLKPLQGNFILAIDKLNLDQYQTTTPTQTNITLPKNTDSIVPSATIVTPATKTNLLPTCLQDTDITGKVTIDVMQVNNMQLQQVNMPITLKNSEFVASPITAQFYQGILQADVKANYAAALPSYALSAVLNNINVNSLLQQAANYNKLRGTGQINFSVNAQGNDKNSMLSTLNGNGQMKLSNGSYTGFDIMGAINSAASLFLKQQPVNNSGPSQTNFTELNATFEINNGLIANNDLMLSSPVMNITGNGTISLVTQGIDYNLSVTPINITSPQIASLQKAIGGSIPIKVKGTINNPKVKPDMDKISISVTKQTINQNLNDINKGIDKFSKGVAKTLDNILGN